MSSEVKVDTISEKTSGSGVTIDGLLIKDGGINEASLTLKNPATADNSTMNLVLQTGETDIAADDVIGKISFQAPDEGTGTDAILVAAGIQATSEGDFSSSNNATQLEFMTGASEAATAKMYIKSDGKVGIGTDSPTRTFGIGGDGVAALEGSSNALTFYDSSALKAYITSQSFGDHNGDGLGLVTSGDEPIKFICNGATQWAIETTGHLIPGANDHGIYLGVSSATASNLLDDYEEGTYTPAMTVASGSLTVHGSHNTLAYTKIGRVVHVQGEMRFSAVSSPSGNFSVSLPFAVADLGEGAARFMSAPVGQSSFGGTPDATYYCRTTSEGTTTAFFATHNSGSDTGVNANQVSTSTEMIVTFTYIAA